MNVEKLRKNLEQRGYKTSYFETAQEAVAYLNEVIDQTTVGMGGSVTIQEMGLHDSLSAHNDVYWHWAGKTVQEEEDTKIYLTSVNGLAETGELINIDGNGNRVASTIYGHEKVYYLVGSNKVAADFESALWRARNIAAPKNAQRLGMGTPCAAKADRCYDCNHPQRICKALSVFWRKPGMAGEAEVVLINQPLGY
ncbi:MAG: lactate utilization protein [Oscillospiraceae bacterium]|nr:lactate utilization protein [Oscillospiraceae bacterium]